MNGWIGRTLGKVQIESLIARGGVAEVYLGTHTTLQRKVAIKILRDQFEDDPNLLERFQREAVVVSRLRHPNIVQVYDFDAVEGHPYIVMEHIPGPSLSRYLDAFHAKGKRLDLPVISRLLTSVASALEYAHKRGVIHRDVKPGNILLTSHSAQVIAGITMPAGFEPILTDFGLVRFLNSSRHTTAGQIAGTPAYMSPEQARGEATDERTDIYSLGIILYEMLSGGRVPFEGETTMSVLLKQIHDPVEPIPGLSPSLQDVLNKALAKDRVDRYQSSTEFASEFQSAIENRSWVETVVHDTPASEPPKPKTKPRVKRWPAIASALLITVLGGFLWLGGIPKQEAGIIPDTGNTSPPTSSPSQPSSVQTNPVMILRFRNGNAIADQAEFIARAMPIPPGGSQYEVWLIGDDTRQSLGSLDLDDEGNGGLIYTDGNASNLIGLYDRAEVSTESVPDDAPEAPGPIAYASAMPIKAYTHVRSLLASSPITPDEKSIAQGLIANIQSIHQIASEMKTARGNADEAGVRQKAEAILNLLAGDQSPDYKDWDGDGQLVDPSDGYGLMPNDDRPGYIQALSSEVDAAAAAPDATLSMIANAGDVNICAQNLAAWAPSLRETMLTILLSPAGSDLDRQISDSLKFAGQLLDGIDLDADQEVDLVPGECGATSAIDSAYQMAEMLLLPISMIPTATATELFSQTPSSTPAPLITASPTRAISESQNTPIPPSATRPGNRQNDKPKPTKRNP